MRANTLRKRLWLGVAAGAAAIAATSALGVTGGGTITTIAGTSVQGFAGDGGPATSAKLYTPTGVAVDAQGNVYIADHGGARVRKVSSAGTISTFAGTGGAGFSGDGGLATSARVGTPYGVAVDGNGNVYISDRYNNRVRKVSPGGTITTFAGTGDYGTGSFGDGGPATSAQLRNPYGVAVDGRGNVYIADHDHSKVRKVDAGGTITTFAGTGVRGFSGDGGKATAAKLNSPFGLAVDGRGNVYIADRNDNRVRKVSTSGTITTFAGTGEAANDGDGDGGPATSARIQHPAGMVVDAQGNVYIAAAGSVRKVSPGGTITTFAGGGRADPGDGGLAISAALRAPEAVALDRIGNVYIAEASGRVRKVTLGSSAAALTLTLGGASPQRLLAQRSMTVTSNCSAPCSLAATGSVTILGTPYAFGLTGASARLAAGSRTLTLRFAATEQARFRRLLKPGQQARAVITVRATDKARNTTTSKRTIAVSGLTATTAPARTGKPAAAKLGAFVDRIGNVLSQSAAGRRELAAALSSGFNCSISPSAAGQRIARVIDNRRSILGQLSGLRSPDRQTRDALGMLRSALRHSITADIHYRDGFSSIANARCPLPSNADFALARRSDVLASAAKQQFVSVFNRLARSVNRRTWSASEI